MYRYLTANLHVQYVHDELIKFFWLMMKYYFVRIDVHVHVHVGTCTCTCTCTCRYIVFVIYCTCKCLRNFLVRFCWLAWCFIILSYMYLLYYSCTIRL